MSSRGLKDPDLKRQGDPSQTELESSEASPQQGADPLSKTTETIKAPVPSDSGSVASPSGWGTFEVIGGQTFWLPPGAKRVPVVDCNPCPSDCSSSNKEEGKEGTERRESWSYSKAETIGAPDQGLGLSSVGKRSKTDSIQRTADPAADSKEQASAAPRGSLRKKIRSLFGSKE